MMKLNYKEIGDQNKELVILHGLFGSSDNWLTIARQLTDEYKVYLLDQRNHGDSPHDPAHTYEAMAEDLKNFIVEHDLKEPHVLGHSMGGKTAMYFAVKYPSLFDKLVIVDIAPKSYPVHHDQILTGLKSIDLTQVKTRGEADKQLAEYVPELGVRQFLLKNLNRDANKSYSWKINLEVIDKSIEKISEGLPQALHAPKEVLFVGGKNSHYIEQEDYATIDQFFPGSQIEMVDGAGHWIHAEKPDEFLKIVRDFLSK